MPDEFEAYDPYEQQQPRPLHTKQRGFVVKPMRDEEVLFQGQEVLLLDPQGGARSIEQATVYRLDCGHYVGLQSPAELSAFCGYQDCDHQLCHKCGDILRCARCLTLLCKDHARLSGGMILCKSCRPIILLQRFTLGFFTRLHSILARELK